MGLDRISFVAAALKNGTLGVSTSPCELRKGAVTAYSECPDFSEVVCISL
jgi:hypothetical protein